MDKQEEYLTPNQIKQEYGLDPTHVKRDLLEKGARHKEYIFCNRKCISYLREDVDKLMAEKARRKEITKNRYRNRPCVMSGTKSQLKKVLDNKIYTKLRNAYYGMIRRCYTTDRKDYWHYREAGIGVCKEWLDNFDAFALWALNNGMRPDLTLDRINNEQGYSPDNCRWTDKYTQNNNSSQNIMIYWEDDYHTISELAKKYGMDRDTLWYRLRAAKWPVEKALLTPVRKRQRN